MKGLLSTFLFRSIMLLYFFLNGIALVTALEDYSSGQRIHPDRLAQNQDVIDKIFNIPITAVKQTAVVAQSFSPDRKQTIDDVFQIPISTLAAVGDLVKSTSAQRLQNAEEIEKKRQERRDRIQAQREEQRLRRERIHNERLQKKSSRYPRHHHRDPLGLNSLTKFFIGHHGILNKPYQLSSVFGDHSIWSGGSQSGHGSHGTHGTHGSHGDHGTYEGVQGIHESDNIYEVNEEVDEGNVSPSIGTFLGLFSLPTKDKIRNKVAPWQQEKENTNFDRTETRRGDTSRFRYEELPLENKIAPRSDRVSFVRR